MFASGPMQLVRCLFEDNFHYFFIKIEKKRELIFYNHRIPTVSVCLVVTVMILNFQTDRSGQTVQTQIRLLLEEQSDQGLHCLLFQCMFFTKYLQVWPLCLNYSEFLCVRKFRNFTVGIFPQL